MKRYKSVMIQYRDGEWQIGHTLGDLFNQFGSFQSKESAIDYCEKNNLKYKIFNNYNYEVQV